MVYASVMIEPGTIRSVLTGEFPALGIKGGPGGAADGTDFADLLVQAIDRIESLTEERDQLSVDLALGKPVELHQVMLASTKAQIALELLIELRNKLIEAYQQISSMPV